MNRYKLLAENPKEACDKAKKLNNHTFYYKKKEPVKLTIKKKATPKPKPKPKPETVKLKIKKKATPKPKPKPAPKTVKLKIKKKPTLEEIEKDLYKGIDLVSLSGPFETRIVKYKPPAPDVPSFDVGTAYHDIQQGEETRRELLKKWVMNPYGKWTKRDFHKIFELGIKVMRSQLWKKFVMSNSDKVPASIYYDLQKNAGIQNANIVPLKKAEKFDNNVIKLRNWYVRALKKHHFSKKSK